jgi:acyl-CoA thioester hydrolase
MPRLKLDFPASPLFTTEIPIRVTDLNYGNHLAHDRLVSILHEARVRFFRAFGFEERNTEGRGILLVDLAVTYQREAFYGQTLRVDMAIGEAATRGCELLYRVTDAGNDEAVALAKTGIVFIDPATRRVVSIPPAFRALIEKID